MAHLLTMKKEDSKAKLKVGDDWVRTRVNCATTNAQLMLAGKVNCQ